MDSEILDDVFETDVKLVPATKGTRFVNYLIDYFFMVFIAVAFFLFADMMSISGDFETMFNIIFVFLFFGYYFFFELATSGKTLGKIITKTRAVDLTGGVPSMGQFAGRAASRFIPFEGLSFFGSGPGGWHDSLPNTMVIDEKQSILPDQNSGFIQRT